LRVPPEDEAAILGKYVLGRPINERCAAIYAQAIRSLNLEADPEGERALVLALRHRWAIRYLDGALALLSEKSSLRQRLVAMTAVLETEPSYADWFLPTGRPPYYFAYSIVVALRAAATALIGLVLLKLLR
jgi:hypothetical protein